jgi:hypothetical protein
MADPQKRHSGFGFSGAAEKMPMTPAEVFTTGRRLAELMGRYIDEPLASQYTNPSYGLDPRFSEFMEQLSAILPGVVNPQQFGSPQNPPQYRGIRFILPESRGGYEELLQNLSPQYEAINQAFRGDMIRRGYPVRGGSGQFFGREPGFNPIGFGAR